MRVMVFFEEEEKVWVVGEKYVSIEAQKLFLDGEQINDTNEEIIVDHVTEIILKGIKNQLVGEKRVVYKAEEVHIYTLPYLFARHQRGGGA